MSILNEYDYARAILFAAEAHADQLDKGGKPYILHPIRVSEAVDTLEQKIVAVLHDVVEDTDTELYDIYTEFGTQIRDAVDAMTHRNRETNYDYMHRVADNEIAKMVKLADMADNSSPVRMAVLHQRDQDRLKTKYNRHRHFLLTGEWIK
jgi:(p)ppGpp synthase/HD superfamily hydrolase